MYIWHGPILTGSFLPEPDYGLFGELEDEEAPGKVTAAEEAGVELNAGRSLLELEVTNTGDRPIQVRSKTPLKGEEQGVLHGFGSTFGRFLEFPRVFWMVRCQVGSHYHFIETNKCLVFDREKAYGRRLNVPSGSAVRFEPGDSKVVTLVEIGGKKRVVGALEVREDQF